MTDVNRLPAFDRVQTPDDAEPPTRSGKPGWLLAALVLVLVGAGVAAWMLWPSAEAGGDVLVQLTDTADRFIPDLVTTEPEQAQSMILNALGWAVAPPDLPGLALVGVGLPSIGTVRASAAGVPADVEVPTFVYEGADGERATVFAYDYILLDRIQGVYDLPEGTYAGLSEPVPIDSRVVDGTYVVTWRTRAMIFSAVTQGEETADRIRQAVSA